ncbi:ABC transporter permease [Paraburkholderia caballeronis]|uniref:ABC transporter permease n=1 Tax=Paraburkholderia caballeronis TaxID=416943 RepID=UPI001064B75B|nr:ABC transporter permease [Paraburkholderia caballeronis]TDV16243.1 peptide/nickel transport system permease protein [Paraburkholderia caballeronis]TDV20593.1 peptide/nickel transport system permease protein [Paraburkholderia caballeronis]TDV33061.1 peptide/nickel transport system permease protein [Paraburkholderia caballeronis]
MSSESSDLLSADDAPAGASPWRRQLFGVLAGSRAVKPAQTSRASRRVWSALLRNPSALAGLILLAAIVLVAAFAGRLFPGDPLDMVAAPFEWPGADPQYWLGTDSMGRDVAAGIAHGARVSLLIGASAALVGLAIGTLVGALGGFFGGVLDNVLVRITELFQTVPSFLLVIVIVAIGHPDVTVIALAIGVASWPTVARIVRAEFRTLRHADFVLAARTQGFGNARIIFGEILPNALPPVIVTASVMVASAILIESSLSFLGMGDPNVQSWGAMIGAGRESLRTAWYLTAIPGAAIVLAVLALNLLGDGLNDALNPRLNRRGGE